MACDLLDPAQVDALVPRGRDDRRARRSWSTWRARSSGPARPRTSRSSLSPTLDLNLVAPFRLCQAVFPHMRALSRGSIVNVSSISGQVGIQGIREASYAASKAGLSA